MLASRKVPGRKQDAAHDLSLSGKCIRSCYLVGAWQAWPCGVVGVSHISSMYEYVRSMCVLVAIVVKNSLWMWELTKLRAGAPYCSQQFWIPYPKSLVQDKVDRFQVYHGRKGTSVSHWQSQVPDIQARTVLQKPRQRPLRCMFLKCWHKSNLLCRLFPFEMQWYVWHSEANTNSPLGVSIVFDLPDQ